MEIEPEQASGVLERFRVIDVREPFELDGPLGFIAGAENVPLGSIEHDAVRLEDAQPLLLVCRSGKRSSIACERLREAGIPDATNLVGGMIAWHRAQLDVQYATAPTRAVLVDRILDWVAQVGLQTREAVVGSLRERLPDEDRSLRAPTRATVERILEFAAESLAASAPPDLDLSLASFRRSLAAL